MVDEQPDRCKAAGRHAPGKPRPLLMGNRFIRTHMCRGAGDLGSDEAPQRADVAEERVGGDDHLSGG